jgi:hypothetical protein
MTPESLDYPLRAECNLVVISAGPPGGGSERNVARQGFRTADSSLPTGLRCALGVRSRLRQNLELVPQRPSHDLRCHFLGRSSTAPAVAL